MTTRLQGCRHFLQCANANKMWGLAGVGFSVPRLQSIYARCKGVCSNSCEPDTLQIHRYSQNDDKALMIADISF